MSKRRIEADIDENINYLKELLGVGESFDIIFREYKVGYKRAASFSINGMTNDLILTNVLEDILLLGPENVSVLTIENVFYSRATHSQVKLTESMEDAVTSLLSGEMLFLLDGAHEIIILDARTYPARQPSESTIEKVTRGSKDAFVETLVFNTALLRRRLRDPNLRFEITKIGTRSRCDIAIAYLKDITDPKLLDMVKTRLNMINIDGIPMAEKAIEEYIAAGSIWNPLPAVRYTERPDVAAVHLLEGHVCIIIDNSPNIMILPTTMWHHVQHVEEYHQPAAVGTYLRLIRLFGMLLSLLLTPLWLTIALQHELLPASLEFLGPKDPGVIPLGLQFVLAELGVELVRMATVHVPTAQSTSLGFIGAFMLGEFATKVGLFTNEVIFFTAIVAVGAFATPSIEFAMAIKLFRIILVILVALFNLPGLLLGLTLVLIALLSVKSFGLHYLWPLFPLNATALKDVFFRLPLPSKILRPTALKPLDKDRLSHEPQEKNKK